MASTNRTFFDESCGVRHRFEVDAIAAVIDDADRYPVALQTPRHFIGKRQDRGGHAKKIITQRIND
jgi:hypothetical protein